MPKTLEGRINQVPQTLRKAAGAHYTPEPLAEFLSLEIVDAYQTKVKSRRPIKLLDPAVGNGALLESMITVLRSRGFCDIAVTGYDTDQSALDACREHLEREFPGVNLDLQCADFLSFFVDLDQQDFFQPVLEFDLIIANPPYVRTQVLGAAQAQEIAGRFGLSGRVDLAYPFIKGMARALGPNGVAGIITSNRFMTTKAGAAIRSDLQSSVDLLHVWDLGDTKIFEAAVLPAIVLYRRKDQRNSSSSSKFSSVYLTKNQRPVARKDSPLQALQDEGVVELPDGAQCIVRHGTLDAGRSSGDVWRISSIAADRWLSKVQARSSHSFGEIGKVKVGVKTTADKVFIRSDWESMSKADVPELLRPLTTHHIATRWRTLRPEKGVQILYPHVMSAGKRIPAPLEKYPRAARYLDRYRKELEARTYVVESGRSWYEIWVPHDPAAWKLPKLVFRDISEQPTFWMDLDGTVVNGDCYWMTSTAESDKDLLWLALAVGNSSFIETFYDVRFNNKLYSSRRRFMTQYVEQFPLPKQGTLSARLIELAKALHRKYPTEAPSLEAEIDKLVWTAFGLRFKEVPR